MLYILVHGQDRACQTTDRLQRRRIPQEFSVIFTNRPSAIPPSITSPILFISYSLIPPCLQNLSCLVLRVL